MRIYNIILFSSIFCRRRSFRGRRQTVFRKNPPKYDSGECSKNENIFLLPQRCLQKGGRILPRAGSGAFRGSGDQRAGYAAGAGNTGCEYGV